MYGVEVEEIVISITPNDRRALTVSWHAALKRGPKNRVFVGCEDLWVWRGFRGMMEWVGCHVFLLFGGYYIRKQEARE
ncbi:hypothetical protein BJ508DRAFT_47263 [Ascobolus immersus RN42]|uniref:Uncharacterized protein n=1 Tax=Ascobolus immersus RN42 TaxID=1160509 RepID=A0A3N4IH84_ASCIM|nr:hypothetical protein BJ508DRAFT_47263 [Ascobolus immersus RN42]